MYDPETIKFAKKETWECTFDVNLTIFFLICLLRQKESKSKNKQMGLHQMLHSKGSYQCNEIATY